LTPNVKKVRERERETIGEPVEGDHQRRRRLPPAGELLAEPGGAPVRMEHLDGPLEGAAQRAELTNEKIVKKHKKKI
jgi:hypothetical protein